MELYERLGFRALTPCGDDVLKGNVDVSTEEEGVSEFLQQVAIPPSIRQIGTSTSLLRTIKNIGIELEKQRSPPCQKWTSVF